MSRRIIEEEFPVQEVSVESAKEKNIRHGHISTLHTWWARRPLSSSRAIAYAAFMPQQSSATIQQEKREFIIQLSKWENTRNSNIIEKAKRDIQEVNGNQIPKVLDPFAGGAAIPLEALRLGCETYSSDYNPVSVLIQKCTLEYPQKYGRDNVHEEQQNLLGYKKNPLLEEVKKRGKWILEETKSEIGKFYPPEADGSVALNYIWARTIPCQNPSCNTEIPLMRHYWLARKNDRIISLCPTVNENTVKFKIVGSGYENLPTGFDPNKGTVSKAICTCLVCGHVIDDKTTRRLFKENKAGHKLICLVSYDSRNSIKMYRIANNNDVQIFEQSAEYLQNKRKSLFDSSGIDPVPDEPLPIHRTKGSSGFRVILYGAINWGDLFSSRQKIALITFIQKVRDVYFKMIAEGYDADFIKAVVSYLALGVSRMTEYSTIYCRWDSGQERSVGIFGRHAIPMVWDYSELNPLSSAVGSWEGMSFRRIWKVIDHLSDWGTPGIITLSSATELPYHNNFFDAIFTDPPYYDNIMYADCSEFFYVWLKRVIGDIYPELFATPLVPRSKEIVADIGRQPNKAIASKFYEDMLRESFKEINRVLKPDGIAVIVYAHKSTAGWESLINSLLDSGLLIVSAWPIHTEMKVRLIAKRSASLGSSIYMVARKMNKESIGFFRDVKERLKKHLDTTLDKLWNESVIGADFFISAIGSSIQIFGKYEKIIDDEGKTIRADRFLEIVRIMVTDFTIRKILRNGFAESISKMTRFYLLYRWAYGEATIPFSDGLKLAQSVGIDLDNESQQKDGFIRKSEELLCILGPDDRKITTDLNQHDDSRDLITVLHIVLLLWKKGKKNEIMKILRETGFGNSDIFYRVAQAISETLPYTSQEKKLIEGFLAGKNRISEEIGKEKEQQKLFE